jgi:hypothetical protein
MNAMLADLGNVVLSGLHSTPALAPLRRKSMKGPWKPPPSFDFAPTLSWASSSLKNWG